MSYNFTMACPRCKNEKIVKAGLLRGRQRYLCKQCSYKFTQPILKGKTTQDERDWALALFIQGYSLKEIGARFGVSDVAVFKWKQRVLNRFAPQRQELNRRIGKANYLGTPNVIYAPTDRGLIASYLFAKCIHRGELLRQYFPWLPQNGSFRYPHDLLPGNEWPDKPVMVGEWPRIKRGAKAYKARQQLRRKVRETLHARGLTK